MMKVCSHPECDAKFLTGNSMRFSKCYCLRHKDYKEPLVKCADRCCHNTFVVPTSKDGENQKMTHYCEEHKYKDGTSPSYQRAYEKRQRRRAVGEYRSKQRRNAWKR